MCPFPISKKGKPSMTQGTAATEVKTFAWIETYLAEAQAAVSDEKLQEYISHMKPVSEDAEVLGEVSTEILRILVYSKQLEMEF
jgi:hypothetical protein